MVVRESPMTAITGTRVGFAISPGNWLGGRNYQRNLFAALRLLPGSPIVPIVFTGQNGDGADKDFPETEIVRTSILDRKTPSWFARKVIRKATSQDIVLGKLLQRNQVSVVSHSFHLDFHPSRQSKIKTIGWIPDFQHMYMPEFFGPERCRLLDRDFRSTCENCDLVIVSSECARADLRAFSPEHAHKAELLRFIAGPPSTLQVASLEDLQQLYDFNTPYFLLPNQFWVHKNHRTVIRALRELRQRGQPALVLATGSTKDFRDPSYFPSLMRFAADCGVLDDFRVLGQIPYDHLVGLMRHAAAFVNPSQFEGWSTSVEEAKSMGKQIVLSDLPVHREQAPERGFFFQAQDAETLASVMRNVLGNFDAREDVEKQEAALALFSQRLRVFGETYWKIVDKSKQQAEKSI